MIPANPPRATRPRMPGARSNLFLRYPLLIALSFFVILFVATHARADELHPEAFAGTITSRADAEVGLSIQPGTQFARSEELWVYQKRDAIQIGGVLVKVKWARIGKIRLDSVENDSAKALIVEEYEGSSIALGDDVGRLPNTPPRIESIVPDLAHVKPRHETSFFIKAVDDEGDPLSYSAEITGGTLLGADGPSPVRSWIAPPQAGTYWITVGVSDGKGASVSKRLAVEVSVVREADPYKFVCAIGGNSRAHWPLRQVTDIRMDEADNMWVLDSKTNLLRVFEPTGLELGAFDLTFGKSAFGISPAKICLGDEGSVYVLDVAHKVLQRIQRDGKRARTIFDNDSRRAFLLEAPSDIEATAAGDVLVSDSSAGHVSVIDEAGRFVLLFAARGTGNGQLVSPVSVTTNRYGDIFVLDSAKDEIVEFDRSFRRPKGYKCPLEGDTGEILADKRGEFVYVLDSRAGSVRKLGADGALEPVVVPVSGGDVAGPASTSIALRSDGYILIGTENASIWEYDPSGVLRGILGEENLGKVTDIAVSDDGQLFVLDASVAQVNRFDRHRWLKGRFGAKGKYEGQFVNPAKACVDNEGNCYVFDDGVARIQKFYDTGVFAKVLPIGEGVAGNLGDVADIDVADNGDLYILDSRRKAVFIVTREGELRDMVPLTSSDARRNKKIKKVQDIAVDKEGHIYVSDPDAYAVYEFHPEGTRINKLGGKGKEPGYFGRIADLAADGQGYVYVLLKDRRVVSKFNRDGRFIMEIPLAVDENTPSKEPTCIAVDTHGALYVFDNYYKSVFRFMQ